MQKQLSIFLLIVLLSGCANPETAASIPSTSTPPVPNAVSVITVLDGPDYTIISMALPDAEREEEFRPLLGVVKKNTADGGGQMLLADAASDSLSVSRSAEGRISVGLKEVVLEEGKARGSDGSPVILFEAESDELQRFYIKIPGGQFTGVDAILTAEQIRAINGGGGILEIASAQLKMEADLAGFDQQAGVEPDITQIAGSAGSVGGEPGEAFTPDAGFGQDLNDQGFWLVTSAGRLNQDMDGLSVVNATDFIFDRDDPRVKYALEKADGQAVVHTENGGNFVYYGAAENGVFVPKEKQIIALPDFNLPGVEAGTLIAYDPQAAPD